MQVEKYPESAELHERVKRSELFNPVYRPALEALFSNTAFLCALNTLLVASDEQLKNIGMADLTDENAIKKCLRLQGVSEGLAQAVDLICEMASTPEEKEEN